MNCQKTTKKTIFAPKKTYKLSAIDIFWESIQIVKVSSMKE